mmetsp:Transcript_12559/g.38384  ORF Transcript_12559/g.38384 Transcript_12559/m.38384 type:complete len:157 (+) Transcript_12559:75-545(+)
MLVEPLVSSKAVRAWFEKFATDGKLDTDGVLNAFQASGLMILQRCASLLVRMVDRDGDGELGLEEFSSLYHFVHSVRSSFFQVDSRGDKKLRVHDVALALDVNGFNLGADVLAVICESFDVNNRGYLTLADFVELAAFITCASKLFSGYDRYGPAC